MGFRYTGPIRKSMTSSDTIGLFLDVNRRRFLFSLEEGASPFPPPFISIEMPHAGLPFCEKKKKKGEITACMLEAARLNKRKNLEL